MLAVALATASPAMALTCGSKGQPTCAEAPPPGVTLPIPAGGNPYGLQPLAAPLSGNAQLWASVRGYEPYGFNASSAGEDGTTFDDEAFLHEQMGGSIARVAVDWAGIQHHPNDTMGGRPWNYESYLDEEYLAHIRRGVRPVLNITRTPRRFTRHYTTTAGSNVPGCGTTDFCWTPPRSASSGRIATLAADLARRYPLAAGIELWNEPNLANPFWGTDTPSPEYYASLLNLVHDAVKSVNPHMPVVAGALSNRSTDGTQNGYPVLSLKTFLRRMLVAGAEPNMDAVSFHPYLGAYPTSGTQAQKDASLMSRMVAAQQRIVDGYAAAAKPITERIVWTETGASTTAGFSQAEQSHWLSYQYWLMHSDSAQLPLSGRTDAMLIHQPVQDPDPPYNLLDRKGYGFVLVKNSAGEFVPKQVFCTFRTMFGGYSSCPAALDPTG
jgi:hypothetical protein